ncbi:oxidoreductase [Streptomyces sp. 549]|uniref:oxidoreductase n=1 Tax=Streptomyces sp. 549 TaxID=3049076 RepID=UPI0024C20CDC|nr:oxidoreductase [Streptomyces sp. 549]MDK1474315.1 oxidoreductase [Streptomyces sp. 549]
MVWTSREIPHQGGRLAVVTGANSGLGYVTARELARHGARVVLACRSSERGTAALERLRHEVPEADAEYRALDLADLSSVRTFTDSLPGDRLDLLINNAGLMAVPFALTADGFEMQFGVNHLGHFALTGLLLDRLTGTPGARVVTVSSLMHLFANIDLHDLNSAHEYRRWQAYCRSKSANLLFVHELARRTAGLDLVAAAAHPGYSATELQTKGPRLDGRRGAERLWSLGNRLVTSTPELGAAPTLWAATAPGVQPDSFTGPRVMGVRGAPGPSVRASWTRNDTAGALLWQASADLTGVDPKL